jgi:endoglucanase
MTTASCGAHSSAPTRNSSAADSFLDRYVTSDGRVLRRDQGGDIVSEGQAYGMLIAEMANRPSTVRDIWSWTNAHLRRRDGLLMSHTDGSGRVEDSQPAADADTLAAYALLRYSGPDQDALHNAGRQLAAAVLDGETSTVGGVPVVLAGPWAKAMSPPVANPSYWMPAVYTALARFTGDHRWNQAATAAISMVRTVTDNGQRLPTDWVQVTSQGLVPIPNPDGAEPVQYGLDAARLPMWLGTACNTDARRLAAHWWTNVLSRDDRAADLALSPTGQQINQETNPLPLLAAAAAARAAGDTAASQGLRSRADEQSRKTPTYYGDAWLALGAGLLDHTLDPCQESNGG